jgi:hypothetical protein
MQTVTAEFTLTYDDFREAFRANGLLHVTVWTFGWFVTLGLLLALSGRAEWLIPAAVRASPAGVLAQFVLTLAPLGIAFAIMGAAMLRVLRNIKRPRPAGRVAAWGGWVIATLLATLHVLIAGRMAEFAAANGWEQSTLATIVSNLMPVALWVGFYTMFGFVGLFFTRSSTRRIWTGDVTLHRAKRSEAGPTGYTETDALSRREESWLAFLEARETANLFLLYIGRGKFYIVPKRGFADTWAVDAFREMLRQNVSERSNAFSVMRATPVPPPLPAA